MRGERVPNRVRRLAAGEALEVADATAAGGARRGRGAGPRARRGERCRAGRRDAGAGPRARGPVTGGGAAGWRELAGAGNIVRRSPRWARRGIRREARRLGVADLFALADVARLSGHPADAVAPLERIVTTSRRIAQAPLAAFALGRLELDDLGRPQAAAAAFSRALELGAPESLRDNVRARLEEAHARMRTDAIDARRLVRRL